MNNKDYRQVRAMLHESPFHSWWPEEIIKSHIDTPIALNQYIIGEREDGDLFFFATWAFPHEKHLAEYMRTRCFPPEGYFADSNEIWIIDFICLGGTAEVMSAFRCVKHLVYSFGYKDFFWLRNEKKKIGWHTIKE